MQRQNVLIVGAGNIAGLNETDRIRKKPCTHIGAIRSQPSLKVTGIVDADGDRAKAFAELFSIDYASSDLASALLDLMPDIVTVAVPYITSTILCVRL